MCLSKLFSSGFGTVSDAAERNNKICQLEGSHWRYSSLCQLLQKQFIWRKLLNPTHLRATPEMFGRRIKCLRNVEGILKANLVTTELFVGLFFHPLRLLKPQVVDKSIFNDELY